MRAGQNPKRVPMSNVPEFRCGHPNPLPFYLGAAASAHIQAITSMPNSTQEELLAQITCADVSAKRLSKMLAGIRKWQEHPYRREPESGEIVWRCEHICLRAFGTKGGKPVLVIPSLINRFHILDLLPNQSFLSYLGQCGFQPFVIDWGTPKPNTQIRNVEDCVERVLRPALSHITMNSRSPVSVLGYCMGGTLAVALAQFAPDQISRLGLIGTPWDFHAQKGVVQSIRRELDTNVADTIANSVNACGTSFGLIPADLFQLLFALLAPMQAVQKFSQFADTEQTSDEAVKFAAVEDWLAHGVPLQTDIALEIFREWYFQNVPAKDEWRIADTIVSPQQIACPTMVITGQRDHIVPPAMSAPLSDMIPDCVDVSLDMGHVGMIVSRNAHAQVADRLCEFYFD